MLMYQKQEPKKYAKNTKKEYFFCILNVTAKKRRIRSRMRNPVSDPRKDPDPYQNVTDPEHCFSAQTVEQIQKVKGIKSTEKLPMNIAE
jgi:hypothetical protein